MIVASVWQLPHQERGKLAEFFIRRAPKHLVEEAILVRRDGPHHSLAVASSFWQRNHQIVISVVPGLLLPHPGVEPAHTRLQAQRNHLRRFVLIEDLSVGSQVPLQLECKLPPPTSQFRSSLYVSVVALVRCPPADAQSLVELCQLQRIAPAAPLLLYLGRSFP